MHECLRTVLLRRIQRGELSITLLSRQTGLAKSHLSKYLHADGRLSMHTFDRVLAAQHLAAEDLLDFGRRVPSHAQQAVAIPLVSHAAALFEPEIRSGAIRMWLHFPPEELPSVRTRRVASRQSWRRFVAIRIERDDARPMEPLLFDGAIAVIDRHYNSLIECHPPRPNVYAVRDGVRVALRYIDSVGSHLIFRPRSIEASASLIEIAADVSPGEYIAGRVALILNQV